MSFRWVVDDGMIAQGGPIFPLTLPVGLHRLRLEAVDQAGVADADTMLVTVLASASTLGGEPNPAGAGLSLTLDGPVQTRFPLRIRYRIPANGDVRFRIHDLGGRLIAETVERARPAGANEATWDPTVAPGVTMPGGVYFLVLRSGGDQLSRKFFYLR